MSRNKVKTVDIIAVKKPVIFAKSGWQYRKATAEAKSEPLKDYRTCIASSLHGKTFGDYKSVRDAFKEAAKRCSQMVREKYRKAKSLTEAI